MLDAAAALEALLLTAGEALGVDKMREAFEVKPSRKEVLEALAALKRRWEGRGLVLKEVADGLWRFETAPDMAAFVERIYPVDKPQYPRSVMEVLTVIAYRQPVTRADIERIRGVSINPAAIRTLFERGWIEVIGRRDAPGHPELLATTRQFLLDLGLKSLEELPVLEDIREEQFELYDESVFAAPAAPAESARLAKLAADHEELSAITKNLLSIEAVEDDKKN